MNKTEFTYQRWYLRMFCSGIVLPIAIGIQMIIAEFLYIQDIFFWILCGLIMVVGLIIYYSVTEKIPFFYKIGYYWFEDDIVYIQTENNNSISKHKQENTYKVNKLKNVKWLKGDTTSAYIFKVAMLVAEYEDRKITLFSKTIDDSAKFPDTDLYSIFTLILSKNPELKKDKNLDFWYEKE